MLFDVINQRGCCNWIEAFCVCVLFGFAIPSACGIGYHYIIYISRCYILCSFFLYFPFMFEMWAVSWILPNAIFRIGISTAFKNRTTQWTQKKNYQHNICVWTLNNCIKWKWFSPVHPGRHCVAVQIGSLVVASTTHIFKNIRKKIYCWEIKLNERR